LPDSSLGPLACPDAASGAGPSRDGGGVGHCSPLYDGPPITVALQYRQPESSKHPCPPLYPPPGQLESWKHQIAGLDPGAAHGFASAVQLPRRRAAAAVAAAAAEPRRLAVVSSVASAARSDSTANNTRAMAFTRRANESFCTLHSVH